MINRLKDQAARLWIEARGALGRHACPVCGSAEQLQVAHRGWPRYFLRCDVCEVEFAGNPPPRSLYRFIVQREHLLDGYVCRQEMDWDAWQQWKRTTHQRLGLEAYEALLTGRRRVLEVGPAEGQQLEIFRQRGWEALGLEPNFYFANRCRDRDIEVINAFLEDATLPAQAFELVLATHTLEHVADPADAVARMRRALVADGRLILEVPLTVDYAHPEHLTYFTPRSLELLLRRCGLEQTAAFDYRDKQFGLQNYAVMARRVER